MRTILPVQFWPKSQRGGPQHEHHSAARRSPSMVGRRHNPAAKQAMLEIAERYDLLAAYAES
jgi:hypothetical protein